MSPPFTPPLQGRLVVSGWMGPGFFQDMARLFGGIRFRYMDLTDVRDTRFLLRACAETLEVLRLAPTDLLSVCPLADYDLSLNKTLRTLEVAVEYLDCALRDGSPDDASKLLKYALSTIKSPTFSRVAVIHQEANFRAHVLRRPLRFYYGMPEDARVVEEEQKRFGLLRELYAVQDFQLVLHVNIQEDWEYYIVRLLDETVASGRARGEFSGFFPEPLVTYSFV